jgi:hypothetical protein
MSAQRRCLDWRHHRRGWRGRHGGYEPDGPAARPPPGRAENERLRRQEDKDQRKERGAAYYRTVMLLNRLDRFAASSPPDADTLSTTIDEYNKSVSALHLFGVRTVLDSLRDLQRLTREVGDSMASRSPRGDPLVDAFVEAWNDLREEIMDAERRLLAAMRQDVAPHQGDRPQPD